MLKRVLFAGFAMFLLLPSAQAVEGMMSVQSTHSVAETVNRLEKSLSAAGFVVDAVEHHQESERVGIMLIQARART